jgi:hypothetical protein
MDLSKLKNEIEMYKTEAILSVLRSVLNESMNPKGLFELYNNRLEDLQNQQP